MTFKFPSALLLITFCFAQCTSKKSSPLSEENLPSQYYTIDISRDTVLHTANGALINIPKGSLQAEGTNVKLQIKEAYSTADMLLAGLNTKAGKEPLSSGGMIYINPAEGAKATIVKPLAISIPTKGQRDGMQLYKGEKKADGTIDWINPQALEAQKLNDTLERGKQLFVSNCASCHSPTKTLTGGPLAFLDRRRDWNWLKGFIHNSSKMIAEGDPLATCIYNKYSKVQMTAFPTLSEEDIRLLFSYVDYQCRDIDPATIPDFKKSWDSCQLYNKLTMKLQEERDSLVKDNGKQVKIEIYNRPGIPMPPRKPGDTETVAFVDPPNNIVVPADNYASYYQVTIQEWGWYNIDILMKGLPGFENSELMVRIIGEYRSEVNIYLVIPSQKIMLNGGPMAGKTDEYAFYTNDGKIPLPQNAKAYIFAMGESKGQLYFAKTDFITGLKQTPEIQLSVVTKEQMNIEIKKLDIADLNISARDSKNADSIRKIDVKLSELEQLKPRDCDCNCGLPQSDTASMK